MKTKMKSYVKETLARVKGDNDTVVAERNYRMATSSVKGQLAALEGKQVTAEVKVSKAKENLKAAKYPTVAIEEPEDFIKSIYEAQEVVDKAEKELKNINNSIEYAKNLEIEFNADEDE